MKIIEKTIKAGKTVEVLRYSSPRYGKRGRGRPPEKKEEQTSRRAHAKRAEQNLRWILNENFQDKEDALVTLSWKKGTAPEDSKEMKRKVQNFLRRLKTRYKKSGKELKYVYTMEIGPRGSRHVHMVINDVDIRELSDVWDGGVLDVKPLNSDGQYGRIAAYFVKYADKTDKTTEQAEGEKIGKKYCTSRNLRKPKIKVRHITRARFSAPRERKGYRIDKDLTAEGTNEWDGTAWQRIVYVRD